MFRTSMTNIAEVSDFDLSAYENQSLVSDLSFWVLQSLELLDWVYN